MSDKIRLNGKVKSVKKAEPLPMDEDVTMSNNPTMQELIATLIESVAQPLYSELRKKDAEIERLQKENRQLRATIGNTSLEISLDLCDQDPAMLDILIPQLERVCKVLEGEK